MCVLRFPAKVKEMEWNLLMLPPPSGGFSMRHFFQWQKCVCFKGKWGAAAFMFLECVIPGICLSCARSCLVNILKPSRREQQDKHSCNSETGNRAGWHHAVIPANFVTHSLFSFLLSAVCLSLFVSFTSSSPIITRMSWLWGVLWVLAAALGHHLEASGCSVSFSSGT